MLKGNVALITGGSRGIGAAVAKKLASLGADVAIVYSGNAEAADAVCHECRETYGVKAQAYRCNVADFAAVKELVGKVKADFGTVNILVNNAGITKDGLVATMREQDFDDVLSVNLKGTFNLIRHCTGIFLRNRGGRIINIASVTGIIGNAGQANYAASKAGLIGLAKSVAKEYAARNITANVVAPGFIATDMTAAMPEAARAAATAAIPAGKIGRAEDVAAAVAFLAGEQAGYITGQVLCVDGGMGM